MRTFQTFLPGIPGERSSLPSPASSEMYNVLRACVLGAVDAGKARAQLLFSQASHQPVHSTNHGRDKPSIHAPAYSFRRALLSVHPGPEDPDATLISTTSPPVF